MLFVLGVIVVVLVILLLALVRSLDMVDLRRRPEGVLSTSGVWLVVGGGFLAGFTYGVLLGRRGGVDVGEWLMRGLLDGVVVANAGAFYLGFLQRRRKDRDRRDGDGQDRDGGGIPPGTG